MFRRTPTARLRCGVLAGLVASLALLTALWQSDVSSTSAEEAGKGQKLAKPHETTLNAGAEYHAGSEASLVCGVHSVRSLTETVPIAGSDVIVRLKDKDGKTHELYQGKTGANGLADARFQVPELPAGQYTLEVVTKSPLGEEKIDRPVRVVTDAKVLLVSDKPIYQPGQLMHLRALALRPFDLRPIENQEILFEVEDPKGNKVFKRSLKTSAFGIASLDFQLADEVNTGDYHVRALLHDARAEKTVQVKRYVLPKFKVEVKADKNFYLPKETVKVELQGDYFFGKPVANAKVEVIASTFDVAFRKFHTWKGATDANGHATFEVPLPDYFVGQPLQKGAALVKLDVKVLDSADHAETVAKSYPVSDQPIRISLIPEGGKITPGMKNRIFVAAIYPDGTPAPDCDVKLWHDKLPAQNPPPGFGRGLPVAPGLPAPPPQQFQAPPAKDAPKEEPLATTKTNAAGLAEFTIEPKAEMLRVAGHGQRDVEMLGGKQQTWGPQIVLDLVAAAQDARGRTAQIAAALNSEPLGENVLLRLDKAIYQAGDRVNVDVRTSAGLPTVYVDLVRGGQIMLSKWLDVKDGQAKLALDVPQAVFGSVEVHAYQMLASGEIIRDSRVVYVQPRNDLKVEVKADEDVYAPGADGRIRFQVTDASGQPTAAALGVLVVDEAVYALQDLQPGLEKVYFTLQEELLKPQVQAKVGATVDNLVIQPILPAPRQQVAEVLLTAVELPAPKRLIVDPQIERRRRVEQQVQQIGQVLFNYALHQNKDVLAYDKQAGRWAFRDGLLEELIKVRHLHDGALQGIFGDKLTLDDLRRLEKDFTPEQFGKAITAQRMHQLMWQVVGYTNQHRQRFFQGGRWVLPDGLLAELVKARHVQPALLNDAWGEPFRLVRHAKKRDNPTGQPQFDFYDLVSSGPDRKPGGKDDVALEDVQRQARYGWLGGTWWMGQERLADHPMFWGMRNKAAARFRGLQRENLHLADGMRLERAAGGFGGRGGAPVPMAAPDAARPVAEAKTDLAATSAPANTSGGAAPVTRVREFFPETMLWQPSLITDDRGTATLAVNFADSITTWRLSASANSRAGALGSATVPLKVFQDFFVDLDLPVSLTQGDEVAFPVAVYNYLKTPQTVRIELQQEPWFELLDPNGLTRKLDLQPNEVTSVRFRIKARKLGPQPLLVKAFGSKKSDAVRRLVDIVPNGQKVEKVFTDRLTGKVSQTVTFPDSAIPDASKLLVKIYPGAMAQVVEGLDGMLRMPNGCFEQTSSSAYPNVLIVDYIKRNRLAAPQLLLKCEQYLNVGYQRLLTFERPGGGFDWWGREEPLVWLSAYGLQEFSDMAKVYPIDRGILDRTQAFLMRKRDKDGTWSKIGATHGETIERMGDPKLLLTSYVTWSLLESGFDRKQLEPSVRYIRDNVRQADDNAYVLALAANALAAYDPKDDRTLEAVARLDKLRKELPDWKAISFPAKGMSLTYAHGDGVTVETTALAALAMLKTGQFNNSANQALTYLVKSKHGNGTWGGTQATILALKALLSASGPNQKGTAHFVVKVNGQEAARGKVDEENADVLQAFDLKGLAKSGANQVEIEVNGETSLLYQIVGRHYEPWQQVAAPKKPAFDVSVSYDRTKLATNDLLKAKATLTYHGQSPTYMVMLDLGIAPGFTVDAGEFAEMVDRKQVKRFEVTARQVILYLGDVRPNETLTFEYTLRPKYPLRARTPASTAYEYNTPSNRGEARPVELVVEERK